MAIKGKVAKTKRNNIKRNKLVKQGVIKKSVKKISRKNVRDLPTKVVKPAENVNDSEDSDQGEDMLEMVEKEDMDFLKNAITNRSYNIYNKVKYTAPSNIKVKKRKIEEDESLENRYEEKPETDNKKMKRLLPIKTKRGVVHQEVEDTRQENDSDVEAETAVEPDEFDDEDGEEQNSDEEQFELQDNEFDISKPISTAKLIATRNEVLRQRKIHIGTLSSGVLENPEEKVTNLRTLLKIMDEGTPEVFFTIRKLAIVSLLEVFKDVLPSYEIKSSKSEGIILKKDTLKLYKYEENLLQYYKKYLQKLEKICFTLVKKKGDSRKRSHEEMKLGELAVHAMCDLLVTHPYFNYGQNIAQVIVPFLNSSIKDVREIVKAALKNIIKEDKKEELTLRILRIINQYLKNHAHNVNIEMVEILLSLNLRDVNLDLEREQDTKQKKLNSRKQNVLQYSKRERKRKKKLVELEKEMLETKAEENKLTKQKTLTEITKIVFNIYFRILKSSSNTKVLGVCLEGLAKFAHCINLEFYVDIVNVLDKLLKEEWLGYREKLHCIQTVFAILSGQGEALNLDPTRFYNALYKDLLESNAAKSHDDFLIVIKTLNDALIKRRKKITNKRTIGFVKRLATLSLQLLHNGCLGSLGLVKNVMQLNRSVDILLDFDSSVGDGKFHADLADPEYANAGSSALYEMVALSKHYHPGVRKMAVNIAHGVPASGEGSLDLEYGKRTVEDLFTDFSMSEMAFNPAIPIPNKAPPKNKYKPVQFSDTNFEVNCRRSIKANNNSSFWIN